jgi:hypothetical protein
MQLARFNKTKGKKKVVKDNLKFILSSLEYSIFLGKV